MDARLGGPSRSPPTRCSLSNQKSNGFTKLERRPNSPLLFCLRRGGGLARLAEENIPPTTNIRSSRNLLRLGYYLLAQNLCGEVCHVRHEESQEVGGAGGRRSGGVKAFWAFDKAAMAAGAIPAKYKELMALAVAFTTQCPYCIEIHGGKAREAGATDQEISEAVVVAAALRAGAAITHGTHALKG